MDFKTKAKRSKSITLTPEQIQELRREALAAGDVAMVAICDRAARGNAQAKAMVRAAISSARAM